MRMTAPLEVGICCRDLDGLARFYEETLACRRISLIEVPSDKSATAGLTADGYRVVRLETPWGERLKLLEPRRSPAAAEIPAWILDRQGAGYLTFIVEDLQGTIGRLRAAGLEPLTGPDRVEVRPGTYLAFCRDPEGNVLEFVEYADIGAYRPELAAKT